MDYPHKAGNDGRVDVSTVTREGAEGPRRSIESLVFAESVNGLPRRARPPRNDEYRGFAALLDPRCSSARACAAGMTVEID